MSTTYTVLVSVMERYATKEHRALTKQAKRPNLVKHYNDHPELVDDLLQRAEKNRRLTPPAHLNFNF